MHYTENKIGGSEIETALNRLRALDGYELQAGVVDVQISVQDVQADSA